MKQAGKTPPFRDLRGEPVPGSMAQLRYLRIGGIDQWALIRGERATNPPLVLLHGGPGMSETSFFRRCNAPLEKSFTVVYWDQRGAGKSYDRRIPSGSMTVEQFVTDQWISELSAFGSPVRPLMVTAILIHGLLLIAFGVRIRRVADSKSLRWIGLLLIVAGVIGLPTHTVFAMSSRWMTSGFNDTMHASLSLAFGLIVFVAVALSAVAYPGWFRLYAIATIPILVGFGAASSVAIQGIEQNFTPSAGAFERINAYSYFAWLVVLAVTVHRAQSEWRRYVEK